MATRRRPAAKQAPKLVENPSKQSAGERLVEELSKPDDQYSLTFLIEQAGQVADYLEKLRGLVNGDRDAWLKLHMGTKVVEVRIDNALTESRQQMIVLQRLFAEIHRQRAAVPTPPDDDDLAGL